MEIHPPLDAIQILYHLFGRWLCRTFDSVIFTIVVVQIYGLFLKIFKNVLGCRGVISTKITPNPPVSNV
jgi:hypothetical protein